VGQRQSDGFRIESSEEVLAERAAVILKLSERVKSLEVFLNRKNLPDKWLTQFRWSWCGRGARPKNGWNSSCANSGSGCSPKPSSTSAGGDLFFLFCCFPQILLDRGMDKIIVELREDRGRALEVCELEEWFL
jgi:hypothetical protein